VPAGRASKLIVSCEHGGNRIPRTYRSLFLGQRARLQSHLGYDPGALALARDFAAALKAELFYSTVSRLLVDLNRSLGHPRLFSRSTKRAPRAVREAILDRHYLPHRKGLEERVSAEVARGQRVVHLSCHSFTPRLGGVTRRADVGLLYDPRRAVESALCEAWRARLLASAPRLRVRRNYPYRGRADGVKAQLRRRFGAQAYVGIELEVNQKHARGEASAWRGLRRLLVAAFAGTLAADRC
jgi:predicted N-formylglutamate amidohydrolase